MSPQVAQSDAGAGINRWQTYEERAIPGIGKAMVNVGTGNLLIQATDVDVPERGLDLVIQRTYNSQSRHDANGDDGGEPAVFGNGWTNTYDAHLIPQYNGQTLTAMSVYDTDGTRCDYTPNSDGSWKPCTGEYATLEVDPNDSCSYWWIKKTGTAYWFHNPLNVCLNQPATVGHVYAIYGRNNNNYVTLSYSFVPNEPETSQNITEIDVNHGDGQTLKMTFAQVGSGGPNELATITRPDNQRVNYYYDNSGDLQEVDRPGNDAATILPETYGIQNPIQFACGPRATISKQSNGGNGKDGSCLHFDYDSNTNLIDWIVNGVLNFNPGDGFGMLQPAPAPTGWQNFYTANFVYGYGNGTPCGHTLGGTTTMCDSDGHSTVWTVDSSGRVASTQIATGSSNSLITTETWDTNNDIIETTDARGNKTDYGYDTKGNTVMLLLPSIQSSQGQLRPMSLYSYDNNNNITAYCDPVSNVGKSPPNQMTDSLCPTTTGSGNSVYQYSYPSYEPFGELTKIYTPCYNASCLDQGNYTQITYDAGSQGGSQDYGLPTKVTGTNYLQKDQTTRKPEEDFTYTANGRLKTYVTGQSQGNGGAGTWTLTYDVNGMNRVVSRQDPDGNTTHMCENLDGSTRYNETPYQYSLDGGGNCVAQGQSPPTYAVALSHDTDGNVTQEVHHHVGYYKATFANPTTPPNLPSTANTTLKYYDGEDRLVEVIQPKDPNTDVYTNSWVTRYYYDITQSNGSADLTFQGKSGNFAGYGNLYKTVELLPSATNGLVTWGPHPIPQNPQPPPPSPTPTPILNQSFSDLNASAFDAMDRPIAKYRIVYNNSAEQLATELLTYDQSQNSLGLPYSDCQNEVSECKYYTYDAVGHTTVDSFSGGQFTPLTRNVTYDPDGRAEQIAQQGSNGDSDTYTYDLDGRLLKVGKQSGQNITYRYYADGKRTSLGGSLGDDSFDYSYAPDGTLQALQYNLQQGQTRFGKLVYTLSLAGRVTKQDDYANNSGPMETVNSFSNGLLAEQDFPPPNNCGTNPPTGSHASMMYSAEGELLGQLVTAPCSFNGYGALQGVNKFVQTWQYNRRGEVIASSDHSGNTSNTFYANGIQIAANPQFTQAQGSGYQVIGAQWDARMGATISSGYANWTINSQTGVSTIQGQTSGITYDRAGRNVNSGYTGFCNDSQGGNCLTIPISQGVSRSYDVENHLINSSGTYAGPSLSTNYTWGANGHPRLIGSSSGNGLSDAVYWDNNTLLYSRQNSGSGSVDDVKIGNDGEYTVTDTSNVGVTFYDRGVDGSVAFCHNSTGGSGGQGDGEASMSHSRFWSGGPANPCGPPASSEPSWGMQYPLNVAWNSTYAGSSSGVGNGWTIGELRADGINDGVNTIQGVRAYDPTAGEWTSPDVYGGDVHDPMTQKAYVWEGNNPVLYSDASGYIIGYLSPGLVNLMADMINNSSIFRDAFVRMAQDPKVTYNFTIGYPKDDKTGKPVDGLSNLFRGNTMFTMEIRPGTTEQEEDEEAHEAGGHGNLLAREGATNYRNDTTQSSMCAATQPSGIRCNNNEVKAQGYEKGVDNQMGIGCGCDYTPSGDPASSIQPLEDSAESQSAMEFMNSGETWIR